MDEKPKSIWKKPWQGYAHTFRAWLILVAAIFLILVTLGELTGNVHGWPARRQALFETMVASLIIVTIAFCLWTFIRWLFCWRNLKRSFFVLACLATLIALFYAEEDWRGKHDWEKFKREWEARGERFDWQSIVPPPVPDNQNFAFSPVWIAEERYVFQETPERAKAWYGDRIYGEEVSKIIPQLPVSVDGLAGTNWWSYRGLPKTPEVSVAWTTSRVTDLKPWQSYYHDLGKNYPATEIPVAPQPQSPAQDVLLALSKFDPVIEQLRQDSARPDSRFPLQYDGMPAAILLPHLAAEKRYAQVLQLRAVAELQSDESEKALDDVKLMLRLTDASRTEPFLISHLVRLAILQITLQPIYEGLAEHRCSDAQLADLDSELAKLDFLTDYESAMRGERALEIANIEFLRHPPRNPEFHRPRLYFLAPFFSLVQELSDMSDGGSGNSQMGFQMLALGFGPSGWLVQNELRIAQFDTKWYLPIVDEKTQTISPDKALSPDNALDEEIRHRTPESLRERLFMPSLGGAAKRFAYAQSSTDLARVAIALERYRLAHGEFPESPDALAPQFMEKIPHDVIGGQPLHYRRTEDGQFVLYSVGWNETDDGGVVAFDGPFGKSGNVNINKGDWVWRYPAE
jgi:hypothetical protein